MDPLVLLEGFVAIAALTAEARLMANISWSGLNTAEWSGDELTP